MASIAISDSQQVVTWSMAQAQMSQMSTPLNKEMKPTRSYWNYLEIAAKYDTIYIYMSYICLLGKKNYEKLFPQIYPKFNTSVSLWLMWHFPGISHFQTNHYCEFIVGEQVNIPVHDVWLTPGNPFWSTWLQKHVDSSNSNLRKILHTWTVEFLQ